MICSVGTLSSIFILSFIFMLASSLLLPKVHLRRSYRSTLAVTPGLRSLTTLRAKSKGPSAGKGKKSTAFVSIEDAENDLWQLEPVLDILRKGDVALYDLPFFPFFSQSSSYSLSCHVLPIIHSPSLFLDYLPGGGPIQSSFNPLPLRHLDFLVVLFFPPPYFPSFLSSFFVSISTSILVISSSLSFLPASFLILFSTAKFQLTSSRSHDQNSAVLSSIFICCSSLLSRVLLLSS